MDAKKIGPARVGDRVWFHPPVSDGKEIVPGRSDGGLSVGRVVEADEAGCYLRVDWEGRSIRLERERILGINRAATTE
jgi:hypothetical protein